MAKQRLEQKEIHINGNGESRHLEHSITFDDSVLPSPPELIQYQQIDPRLVDLFIETTREEQRFRHGKEKIKVNMVGYYDKKIFRTNWWGIFFLFLIITILLGLTGYALYLDRPWFAGIFGCGAFFSLLSIFFPGKKEQ